MKRIQCIMLAMLMILSLSACGTSSTQGYIEPEKEDYSHVTPDMSIINPEQVKDEDPPEIEESDDNVNNIPESENIDVDSLGKCDIVFIDCGQADSILIDSPDGAVLVDAGESSKATEIIEVLEDRSIDTIDILIGTHAHADHIGGMKTIVENYNIDTIIMSPTGHSSKTYEKLLLAIKDKEKYIDIAEVGNVYELGSLKIEIVGPVKDYEDLNDSSVQVIASYGYTDILLTGDAELEAEMASIPYIRDVDIMKAGHHGSSTSNCASLMNVADPEVFIISCGKDNDYGHPHVETKDMLEDRQIPYFRTDEDGTVTVSTDGITYTISTENGGVVNEYTTTENSDSDNIVYVTESGTKYHSSKDCSSLANSKSILNIKLTEAIIKGYERCSKCH